MAAYNKFNFAVQDLCEALHNWKASGGGTYYVMLTNVAPVATNHHLGDLTEISGGGSTGYTAGGAALTISSEGQTSGTEKVVVTAANPTWTGGASGMGPFRYVVVYRQDSNFGNWCWFDYGSSISLNQNDTFTVTFDGSNGLFQLA